MLKKIIDFFTGKKPAPAEPVDAWPPAATAPYKVPEPAATTPIPLIPASEPPKCGCGRSSTGFCVGLHKLSPEAWAAKQTTINPATVEVATETQKKKRTYAKKTVAPKAAAIKAPAKPRAKKPQ
jgi:hypothetical protein